MADVTDDSTLPVRPEVVQAVFSAMYDNLPGKVAILKETGLTRAELREAEHLFLAALEGGGLDQMERRAEALLLLVGDRTNAEAAESTLAEDFDQLTPESLARIRELHDALPDGVRAEYDRRYGKPGL
jgi:hypothetical protein